MNDQKPDADWTDLAEVWTAPAPAAEPAPDLARAVRRRARLATLNFHMEAWGAVVAAGVGVWFAIRHQAPEMAVAVGVFSAFALVMALWARRDARPDGDDTPRAALLDAIRQARSGLRWARAGQATTLAAAAFVGFVAVTRGAGDAPLLAVAMLALTAVGLLFYERYARRCRARIARHEAALAELD